MRPYNTNVKVTLHISDTEIVAAAGKKENELVIIINNRGNVDYNWIKRKYEGVSLSNTTEEVNHTAVHGMLGQLKRTKEIPSEKTRYLEKVRQNIDDYTYWCASNVQVTIYLGDHSATIRAGKEENKLKISINETGEVDYTWVKRTWSKWLMDISLSYVAYPSRIYGLAQDATRSKAGNYIMRFLSKFGY